MIDLKNRYEVLIKKVQHLGNRITELEEENFKLKRNNKPTKINSSLIEFELIEKKSNKFKIFFDKNSLEFKGWETKDAYSNNVSFVISNLKINNQIIDSFFQIPKEEDL